MYNYQRIICKISSEAKRKFMKRLLLLTIIAVLVSLADIFFLHTDNYQCMKIALFLEIISVSVILYRFSKRIEMMGNLGISRYLFRKKYFYLSNVSIRSRELSDLYNGKLKTNSRYHEAGITMILVEKKDLEKPYGFLRTYGSCSTGFDQDTRRMADELVHAMTFFEQELLPGKIVEHTCFLESVMEKKNREILEKEGTVVENAILVGGMDVKKDSCIPLYEFTWGQQKKNGWGIRRISLAELEEKEGKSFSLVCAPGKSLRVMEKNA